MRDISYIMEGAEVFNDKQKKEMDKHKSRSGGKHSINSLSGIHKLPGVKKVGGRGNRT